MSVARFCWIFLLFVTTAWAQPAPTRFDHTPTEARKVVGTRSTAVIKALAHLDMKTLSRYVHPRGVEFFPYIEPEKPRRLKRAPVRHFFQDRKIHLWGSYDGTGDPIKLSNADYFRRFVYNGNFSQTSRVLFNTTANRGNMTNHLPKRYPHAIFVEYHLPAPVGDNEMKWKSLWLVWQRKGGTWYLSSIAHDEWTI